MRYKKTIKNIEHIDAIKKLKKCKGQNFLINVIKAIEIVECLELKPTDTIVEVGPGIGAISDIIIFNLPFTKMIMIEIDRELCEILAAKYKKIKNIEIYHKDVFTSDIWDQEVHNIKLVSNLPFNIQKKFILKLAISKIRFEKIILMMQHDFREIISRRLSAFGAFVHTAFTTTFISKINSNDFFPIPKVQGVVLDFKYNNHNINYEKYLKFLIQLYKGKRKKLRNNKFIKIKDELKDKRAHELTEQQSIECYLDNELE